MRSFLSFIGLSLTLLAGAAQAQSSCSCNGQPQVTDSGNNKALTTLLSGNTMCVAKAGGGWEYQEQHRTNSELWDYKLGSSTVDPTSKMGTWSISGSGGNTQLTHTYTGGTTSSFKVCQVTNSTTYGLCQGTSTNSSITFTVKTGTSTGC